MLFYKDKRMIRYKGIQATELSLIHILQKLIGLEIPVVKEHPFISTSGVLLRKEKAEEIKEKAKTNKVPFCGR